MINIKRILCPVDLAPHSGNALRYALALTRTYEAELVVLYCESVSPKNKQSSVKNAELLESILFEQVEPSSLDGLRWRTLVVATDDIGEEITRVAEAEDADLIIMRS